MGLMPSLPDFLASDFSKLDAGIRRRCLQLHGQRLYLSGATGFFGKNLLALLCELRRQGAVFEVTALSRFSDMAAVGPGELPAEERRAD